MAQEVRHTLFKRVEIFRSKSFLVKSAVHLERADGRDDDHRTRHKTRHSALDVEEFFRAEVCAEARLGDGVLAHFERHSRCENGVAAVGDIGKGSAVDECGSALKGLDEVGLDGVLQKSSHRADSLEVARGDGLSVVGVRNDNAGKTRLQVGNIGGKAENRHYLACNRYVEAVLARSTVCLAAETVHHEAELPVVHVNAALPCDSARVDIQGVALLDMVIEHCSQQIVCRAYGVEVTGEVEVYILHRYDLRIAAAGGAALDAEHGTERRLSQRDRDLLADARKTVGKTDGGRGLALARRGGRDSGDKDELAVLASGFTDKRGVDLRLVSSVLLNILFVDMRLGGNFADGAHDTFLSNFYIGLISHDYPP